MSQNTPPGFGDFFGLFGGTNPFGAISKSISQFQRGVSDFLSAVENFNKTMQQLNGVATRINELLDTVEEPVRAFVPQVAKTIRAADAMVDQLSGPIERVAPGLSKLADVLATPALTSLPTEMSELMGVLGELAHRLQPLGQIAESAGSLFGIRPLAALRAVSESTHPTATSAAPAPRAAPPVVPTPAKPRPAAKASAKKAAQKTPAKKAPAKKAVKKR
jgi:ABC-type transporter Mla subunit MlaD